MTQYRRHFVQGGTYFFTVNLADRSQPILTRHIHALRQAFIRVRREH
ncbi:MAG TPA: transposase, partial [Gammaproteobacteria bacterium]|nr:transposase [Gammaproteobacteria bacterium]